jgi:hypothetical protein
MIRAIEEGVQFLRQTLKDYALVCCLFVFLFIVLGGGLRLNPGGAFLAAATGTPVIICGFTRLSGRTHKHMNQSNNAPARRDILAAMDSALTDSVELSARAEPR